MPLYDPVFALGPFLQLPAYLPSGHGLSTRPSSGQWYALNAELITSSGADLIAKKPKTVGAQPPVMSTQAPAFAAAPGWVQPVLPSEGMLLPGAAVAKTKRGGKAQRKSKEEAASLAMDTFDCISEYPALPSIPGLLGPMPNLSCIAQAPSTASVSTPTCSSSDSAPEDGSQDVDAMVSSRSGLTSDTASEDVGKLPDAISSFKQDHLLQGGFAAGALLEMFTSDRSNSDNSLGALREASEANNVLSDNSAIADSTTMYALAPGLVQQPPCIHSYDRTFIDNFDAQIIDSEAANPLPAVAAQISNGQAFNEVAYDALAQSTASGRHTLVDPSLAPALDDVLGVWKDSKGLRCEVQFDEDSTSSCTVKTSCSGGTVRETSGLIRISQCRGKPAGRIIWGSAFVLELPIKDPDHLQWRSIRGGRDFTWTRERAESEALQVATRKHASVSTELPPDVKACGPEPKPEAELPLSPSNSRSRGGKQLSHKRVWRAVSDKPVTKGSCKLEKAGKTPSEVVAATSRRVKSHSGAWRVIEKAPHK